MKIQRSVRHFKEIPLEDLFRLGFRIVMILIGSALLFVAAIYYGMINP